MGRKQTFISIKDKFSKYLLLLSIIPMLGIGIVAAVLSFTALEDNAEQLIETAADRIASETDIILGNATKLGNQIANDSSIQEMIREPLSEIDKENYALDLMLDSRLDYTQEQNDNIYGIYVIAENGGIYRSTFHTVRNEYMSESDWYKEVINSTEPVWFEPHLGSYVGQSTDIPLISVGINIQDKASDSSLGIVLLEIKLSDIQYIYNKGFLEDGYAFLLNEDGVPIVFPDEMPSYTREIYSDAIENRTSQYMYVETASQESTFTTISVVSYGNIYTEAVHLLLIVALLIIVLAIAATYLSRRLSANIATPITELTELMKNAKTGDLTVHMDSITNDEVGILSQKFNEMMKELNHYTANEITNLKKLQKSEFETLQSQINPHFLYNTLDSVIWMARTGDTGEVVKMVTALTQFFRISLSKGQDVITLETEKNHLESYLTIQSMRYSSILSYEIDIPERFLQYRTLKLLLQPLVENAIYHGNKAVDRHGTIRISVTEDDNTIYFHIEDTGIGMSEEMLNTINDVCKTTNGEAINSYGVVNVSRRMQITFGAEYYPHYESTLNIGTTVTVPVPKHWEDTHENEII